MIMIDRDYKCSYIINFGTLFIGIPYKYARRVLVHCSLYPDIQLPHYVIMKGCCREDLKWSLFFITFLLINQIKDKQTDRQTDK